MVARAVDGELLMTRRDCSGSLDCPLQLLRSVILSRLDPPIVSSTWEFQKAKSDKTRKYHRTVYLHVRCADEPQRPPLVKVQWRTGGQRGVLHQLRPLQQQHVSNTILEAAGGLDLTGRDDTASDE